MTKTEEVKAENASPSNVEDDEIEGELYAPVVMNEESIIARSTPLTLMSFWPRSAVFSHGSR